MHFAIAFDSAIKTKKMSQAAVSKASGIHQTGISRFLRGDVPLPATFSKILAAFAGDKNLRRQLIHAYVRDILDEAHIAPDEVTLRTGLQPSFGDQVDPELYPAFLAIDAAARNNAATRDFVLHMALVVAPKARGESEQASSDVDRSLRTSALRKRRSALLGAATTTRKGKKLADELPHDAARAG